MSNVQKISLKTDGPELYVTAVLEGGTVSLVITDKIPLLGSGHQGERIGPDHSVTYMIAQSPVPVGEVKMTIPPKLDVPVPFER